ncbi:uncharacterized protein DNG_07788 [Cephalotrichum gorgonifer]|uniref:EI24 domain-containing protein n=1 Tax=Cephalotrichum gorgonifer TaxID=2041049 RepID=A0AAE8N494_9PEZI|nr:uncharacterized protein DNG_07788 [Cephalotrichum gorgonifer]
MSATEGSHGPPESAAAARVEAILRPIHDGPYSYLRRAGIAAWYPLRGIWYFFSRRELHPLLTSRLLPLSLVSALVYLILFTFTFLPQFAILAILGGGWNAWVSAVVLVLGEGLVIIQALFEGFFVDEARVDVFDATLINCGLQDRLVAPHRICYPDAPNAVKALGKPTSSAVYTPWSLKQMVELVVFLPLNLIPVVGTPAFILITGSRLGKLSHYRWFKLRGLDKKQTKAEIKKRAWEYLWFGTVAMILELIPVLSLVFLFTTTSGAALFAARLEEEIERSQHSSEEDLESNTPPSQSTTGS